MAKFNFPLNTEAYCSHGNHRAPKEGGKWLIHKHGLTKRWICAGCLEKRKAKDG